MEFPYKIGDKVTLTLANNITKMVEIITISEDWIEVKELLPELSRKGHTMFINKNAIQYMSLH